MDKKTMVIFFVVDTSAQMDGLKSGSVNTTIKEMIPEIMNLAEDKGEAQIKIAALAYSSKARWKNQDGPVDVSEFIWNSPTVGGESNLGAAFEALKDKLSKYGFMKDMGVNTAFYPAIFLFSGGKPADDWRKGLAALKNKQRFKDAIKVAIAVGDDADKSVLKEFTVTPETIFDLGTLNPVNLVRIISRIHEIYPDDRAPDFDLDLCTLYRDGQDAYDHGYYDKAVELWRKAAEKGHADSSFALCVCYENGRGVPLDKAKAEEWRRKAVEQEG
jgi:uncharacterized protein YegL